MLAIRLTGIIPDIKGLEIYMFLYYVSYAVNQFLIQLTGFDGFEEHPQMNYSDKSFQNERHISEFNDLNKELESMFGEIVETMTPECEFELITPSKFKSVIDHGSMY